MSQDKGTPSSPVNTSPKISSATPSPTLNYSDMPTKEEMETMRDEDLDWLYEPPRLGNKFVTKVKENPFVPVGCVATIGALSYGLLQFNRGNMERSQFAMRLRVVAQGSTVIALVLGAFVAGKAGLRDRQKRSEQIATTEIKTPPWKISREGREKAAEKARIREQLHKKAHRKE